MSRQKDAVKTSSLRRARGAHTQTGQVIPLPSGKPLPGHRSAISGHFHKTAPVEQDNSPEHLEALLTINALMRLLSVSRPTIYALMDQEHLPYLKLGRSLRFRPSAVHTWLLEHEQLH